MILCDVVRHLPRVFESYHGRSKSDSLLHMEKLLFHKFIYICRCSTIGMEFRGLIMSSHPALACLVNVSMEHGSDVLDHHNLA